MKDFIDATVFLGVNSKDRIIRVSSKNFLVKRMNKTIFMSLEQVGKCDDVVWRFPREVQDAYYPYMDNLHSVMDIKRLHFDEKTLETAKKLPKMPLEKKLSLAHAVSSKGILYTFDKIILSRGGKFARKPELSEELSFPQKLEELYQNALKLRI